MVFKNDDFSIVLEFFRQGQEVSACLRMCVGEGITGYYMPSFGNSLLNPAPCVHEVAMDEYE